MCGIVGVVAPREHIEKEMVARSARQSADAHSSFPTLKDIIFSSLERLAYRGYDSSGIALLGEEGGAQRIYLEKSSGKIGRLAPKLSYLPEHASLGMGHTRWATHGPPTSINAHPHRLRGMALVHNGIIENYEELKKKAEESGITLLSQTDSEVALATLHLLAAESTFEQALLRLSEVLQGCYALVVMREAAPHSMYILKRGSPLVVGFSQEMNFCASDAYALSDLMCEVLFLDDGDVGVLEEGGYRPLAGPSKTRLPSDAVYIRSGETVELGQEHRGSKASYPYFMYKEILEQPTVLTHLLQRSVLSADGDAEGSQGPWTLDEEVLGLAGLDLSRITHLHVVGCGSAYFAGMIGRYAFESQARIPCFVELASEYRYRKPCISAHTLVIAVSQSGETADTLACVRYAQSFGAQVLVVCNVAYSSIVRQATSALLMGVGPEIGVASTKAFSAQVLCLYLISQAFAARKGLAVVEEGKSIQMLCAKFKEVLALESAVKGWARKLQKQKSVLFIGRFTHAAMAYEGALKFKEITYIHAEGYPAGELKHGPLALIDGNMCVIALAPRDEHYLKVVSNIAEIKARGGRVFVLATEQDHKLSDLCEQVIQIPALSCAILQSVLFGGALQLLAYHTALILGRDVDQPRNLAKSVTVE